MKEKFIRVVSKIILPMCTIMICLSLFRDYINVVPYFYLLPLRIVLLLGAIAIVVLGIIKPTGKARSITYGGKNFKDFFYLNSYAIVERIFCCYFGLYILLRLDKISIIFSFIMLLVLGMYYGHRIANTAYSKYGKLK